MMARDGVQKASWVVVLAVAPRMEVGYETGTWLSGGCAVPSLGFCFLFS